MNDKEPFFSIITPCYNNFYTIERTIKSVINQAYKNFEYIIIDGGSTDGTLELLEGYKKIHGEKLKLFSEPDNGIYDAMNKGIRKARGELIGIINSDDFYAPNALDKVALNYEPNIGVYYGNIVNFFENMEEVYLKPVEARKELNFADSLPIPHPSCFITRSSYSQYVYNDSLRYAADYELLWQLHLSSIKFKNIGSTIAYMKTGGAGSINAIKSYREAELIKKKLGGVKPSTIKRVKFTIANSLNSKLNKLLRNIMGNHKYFEWRGRETNTLDSFFWFDN